jgi:hypothetical protein
MSNETYHFDESDFESGEEYRSDEVFAAPPGVPPADAEDSPVPTNGHATTASASAVPSALPHLVAQSAYKGAQQASTTLEQSTERHRFDWSAALAEEVTLMEVLATSASRAQNLAEALALVAALPVVALRLTPHSYRALWPVLPALIQGVQGVTRSLYDRTATRSYICLLPAILESTVAHLADQAAAGRRPTVNSAAKALAQYTGQIVQDHQRRAQKGSQQDKWQGNGHGNGY